MGGGGGGGRGGQLGGTCVTCLYFKMTCVVSVIVGLDGSKLLLYIFPLY